MPEQIVVCGVIEFADDKILVAKRSQNGSFPGLWEHPGGKVESGETRVMALRRELYEELGITALSSPILAIGSVFFDVPICSKPTLLHAYIVSGWIGLPKAIVAEEIKIVTLSEASKLDGTPGFHRINQMYRQMLAR